MRARKALIALVALVAGFLAHERFTFDHDAWLADYDQLRGHVSRNYANLLWVMEHRDLDPVALHQATLRALGEAHTDRAARAAIGSFLGAFQDGHLRINRTPLSRRLETLFTSEADALPANTTPEKACAALGFHDDTDGLTFASPDLAPLNTPDNSFAAATFRLGDQPAELSRRVPGLADHQVVRPLHLRAEGERQARRGAERQQRCVPQGAGGPKDDREQEAVARLALPGPGEPPPPRGLPLRPDDQPVRRTIGRQALRERLRGVDRVDPDHVHGATTLGAGRP